jgi:hypothetical protein
VSKPITIDVTLRRVDRGGPNWLGIVSIDGSEVYRTWDFYETKELALERVDKWFSEMQNSNLQSLFSVIAGSK